MKEKVILYICADLNAPACLRKLRKFTTCATKRGFRVVVVWPGYYWQADENIWKLDFFRVFSKNTFCSVVLDAELSFDLKLFEAHAEYAKQLGIPFVVLDANIPGAINIMYDDEKMFEEILEHLLVQHKVTKITFAGDEGQPNQTSRFLEVYKSVLAKHNIPFDEERVTSCNTVLGLGMNKVISCIKKKMPEAVITTTFTLGICVSNAMCDMGYSVPGDIIVAGMNGLSNRRAGIPDLTAGNRNLTLMADKALELIEKFLREEEVAELTRIPMERHLSESCGCDRALEDDNLAEYIRYIMVEKNLSMTQERKQAKVLEHFLLANSVQETADLIRDVLPDDTYFCVRREVLDDIMEAKTEMTNTDEYVIFADAEKEREGTVFDQKLLYERANKQGRNAAPLIMYPVYVKHESYGFVISEAPEFVRTQMMMGRFLNMLSRGFAYYMKSFEIRQNAKKLQDAYSRLRGFQVRDAMTGFYNHTGLIQELEKIKSECSKKRESLYYVCVDLDRLGNINDIYGHSEGDSAIMDLADIIKDCSNRNDIVAHLGSDEFIIFLRSSEEGERSVESFLNYMQSHVDIYNKTSDKEYTLNTNTSSGMVVVYEDTDMSLVVDEALSDKRLLKNNRRGNYTAGVEELNDDELKKADLIREVIDQNKFRYAYQPIVKASDGEIFGYEALMRTDTEEPISPLTMLKYATVNKRLYDIERATFFNVLEDITNKSEVLNGKKVFVNSIPGYQIDHSDFEVLKKKYPGIFKNIFIEITEQAEQNDEEIRVLTQRSVEEGFAIAIDDYGCGYSNTAALLRYTPNCVKIDRLLISNLQSDSRKQHFVKNIIEFAHDNNFYALAEGVETADELKASIALGADLIQGFYLAKPTLDVITEIPHNLKEEIEEFNKKADEKKYDKIYVVSKERELMLSRVAMELYTEILLSGQDLTLFGNLEYSAAVKIRVKENTNSTLTIKNIILDNGAGNVGIEIGENATLTLIVEGENFINSNGIKVPETSKLILKGEGNLEIKTKSKNAFGIGNDLQHPFGSIVMDITGDLSLFIDGEQVVGIGGCRPGPGAKIQLRGGNNKIVSSSTAFIGIGSFSGNPHIEITEMHMVVDFNVVNGIGIGSPTGQINVRVSNTFLEIKAGGKSITGIGSATKGDNIIEILSAQVLVDMNSPRVIMVGCPFGKVRVYIERAKVELFGSGGRVLGIGCLDMNAELVLRSVGIAIKITSDGAMCLGVKPENRDFGQAVPVLEVISTNDELSPEAEDIMKAPPPRLEGLGGPPPIVAGPPSEALGPNGIANKV